MERTHGDNPEASQTNEQSSGVQGEGLQHNEHKAQGLGPRWDYSMSTRLREHSNVGGANEQSSEVREEKSRHGARDRRGLHHDIQASQLTYAGSSWSWGCSLLLLERRRQALRGLRSSLCCSHTQSLHEARDLSCHVHCQV